MVENAEPKGCNDKNFKADKFCSSGIVLVHKPVGISSNTAVNIVKRSVGAKKCGHLGTLDLEGEGLLLVTVGSATKLFDLFLQKEKTYVADFEFGFETDTLDLSGKVTKEKPCNLTLEEVESAAKTMIGKQLQMPPMFSAKKVNGKVAYKEALKGRTLELKPKEIEIFDLRVLQMLGKNIFKFEISCSSGTYVRCICRDLAEKLSTYGTMRNILRTKCGGFSLDDAFTIEQIKSGDFEVVPSEKLFDFEKVFLDENQTSKLLCGQKIAPNMDKKASKFCVYGTFSTTGEKPIFLGVGSLEDGLLKLELRLT